MKIKNVLSYGGGLQSTAMLAMSCHGDLPRPDAVIFADTGWERESTIETVGFYTEYANRFDIRVFTVRGGNVREDMLNPEVRSLTLPFFVKTDRVYSDAEQVAAASEDFEGSLFDVAGIEEDVIGSLESVAESVVIQGRGMLPRKCTGNYKIRPVRRWIREHSEVRHTPKNFVSVWLGISTDEVSRMKPADVKWVRNRFPLIELRKSRQDCADYLEKHGLLIPDKSACIGCPFHSDQEWRSFSEEELADAVDFELQVQQKGLTHPRGSAFLQNSLFLHRARVPLSEVDFSTSEGEELESEECEGGCFL